MKEPKDYIIFPLDVSTKEDAVGLVRLLKDHVGCFKIGLELFINEGPAVINTIREQTEAAVFLDLKLHDIPATVKGAFIAACRFSPRFVTVHCDEGGDVLREAAENNPAGTKILAVTVLTSLDRNRLEELGYRREYTEDISKLVLLRARIAMAAGCHGVVCSGQEVAMIKRELGRDLIAVIPGIRPAWSAVRRDDQKRIVTPADAIGNGADYIVVGRPIRNAEDPVEAARRIADEIASAVQGTGRDNRS